MLEFPHDVGQRHTTSGQGFRAISCSWKSLGGTGCVLLPPARLHPDDEVIDIPVYQRLTREPLGHAVSLHTGRDAIEALRKPPKFKAAVCAEQRDLGIECPVVGERYMHVGRYRFTVSEHHSSTQRIRRGKLYVPHIHHLPVVLRLTRECVRSKAS